MRESITGRKVENYYFFSSREDALDRTARYLGSIFTWKITAIKLCYGRFAEMWLIQYSLQLLLWWNTAWLLPLLFYNAW